MKKRIISLILFVVMVCSITGSAIAADWNTEFAELQKYLGVKQSPLETTEQVKEFREIYWYHLFPDKSKDPYYAVFNNQSVLDYDIFYYGWPDVVEGNRKDMSGKWLYLGYTFDNQRISNITFNAKPWKNPQLIDRDYYVDGPGKGKYTGLIPPFRTDYNNPEYVGRAYLGQNITTIEAESYGRRVIEAWAKNVINRDIGWQDGKQFYAIFNNNLDAFLKKVTITVPPTSRSYGQCLAWFRSNNGLTHRTFYIAPTDDIDFIAKRYEWDEPTKTLTVFYEVKGLEKIEGEFTNYLLANVPTPEKYLDYNPDSSDVIRLVDEITEDKKPRTSAWLDKEKQQIYQFSYYNYVKKDLRIPEYKAVLRMPYLKDDRSEDIKADVTINVLGPAEFPEYKENAYVNNKIPVIIPATNKVIASDLIVDKIDPGVAHTKPGIKHSGKIHIRRASKAEGEADEPINTTLYVTMANGKITSSANIPINNLKPGEARAVPFDWQAGTDKNKTMFIVAEINPEKLGAARLPERTYDNNKKSITIPFTAPEKVDLSISLVESMSDLYIGETDNFCARVRNTSSKPITTDIVWRLGGKQIRKASITIPAKGYKDDDCKIKMPNVKNSIRLEVEVNPSRTKPANEVTYNNNKTTFTIGSLGKDGGSLEEGGNPYLTK